MLREVEPEDLLKFGLIPEFIGRLPVLATLGDLSEAGADRNPDAPQERAGQAVSAHVRDGRRQAALPGRGAARHRHARRSRRKTGARGLRSIMEGILLETMYELPTLNGVQEVVITADVVDGRARPLYTYSDKGQAARTDGVLTATSVACNSAAAAIKRL